MIALAAVLAAAALALGLAGAGAWRAALAGTRTRRQVAELAAGAALLAAGSLIMLNASAWIASLMWT